MPESNLADAGTLSRCAALRLLAADVARCDMTPLPQPRMPRRARQPPGTLLEWIPSHPPKNTAIGHAIGHAARVSFRHWQILWPTTSRPHSICLLLALRLHRSLPAPSCPPQSQRLICSDASSSRHDAEGRVGVGWSVHDCTW